MLAGKTWADGPFELIETPEAGEKNTKGPDKDYLRAASYMTLMHNTLIRGLNTIYNQAPHVKPEDYKDFVGYSLCFCEVFENQAKGGKLYIITEIEKSVGEKGLMDLSKEEAAIDPPLQAFKTYLLSLLPSPTPTSFSPPHLLTLLTALSTPLSTYFHSKTTQLLSLSRFGTSIPILKISTASGKKITENLDKETGFLFFLLNNDATYEGGKWSGWPPIPSLVRWGLVKKNVGKNGGFWRFASCGSDGKPQALCATG